MNPHVNTVKEIISCELAIKSLFPQSYKGLSISNNTISREALILSIMKQPDSPLTLFFGSFLILKDTDTGFEINVSKF